MDTILLAIDIGNTNITCGLFHRDRLMKRFAFSTKPGQYYSALKKHLMKQACEAAIISSVVPAATKQIALVLEKLKVIKVIVLGEDIIVPIKNLYQYPKQVGQDRLVNAYATLKLYGTPAIVVDFGTAITFDIISKNKEYLGGLILPGLELSLDALAKKTALLPKVILAEPKGLIGRNTKNSILNGIVYGSSILADGLIEKLMSELGKSRVIATGGNINFMAKYCTKFDVIDPDLTLKGLNLIYNC
jgi:type III pantothenate kinase